MKKYLSFFLTFLLVSAYAQEKSIEEYPTKEQLLNIVNNQDIPQGESINNLRMLGEYYMGEPGDTASYYFNRALHLSKIKQDSFNAMRLYNRLAKVKIYEENDSDAYKYTDSSLAFANYKNQDYYASISYSYQIQGQIHYFQERYDLSLEKFLQANRYLLKISEEEQDEEIKTYIAENYTDLASIYLITDNKNAAKECIEKSLSIAKPIDAFWEVAEGYELLVNYHSENKEYELARKYIDSAKAMYHEIDYKDGVVLLDKVLANVYKEDTNYEKALEIFLPIVEADKREAITYQTVEDYIFVSDIYTGNNNISLAKAYLDSAKVEARESNNEIHSISIGRQQAEIFKKEGNNSFAIATLKNLLSSSALDNFVESRKEIYKDLYELYEENNDFSNALMYHKEYVAIKDSLQQILDKNKFSTLQTEFNYKELVSELETKESQLKVTQEEQKSARQRNLFIIISVSTLAIFALFSFFRQQSLSKARREALESKQEALKLKKKSLDDEVKFKNQQITDFAIHISEKNELLEKVKTKLKRVKVINDSHKEVLNDTLHFINNDIENDKEKIQLYKDVSQTNDSFGSKLDTKFSDLNDKEKKVATMLRLGQTSKQIALQLGITAASVDNYRYNLRKKMNVPKGKSLKTFIQNI